MNLFKKSTNNEKKKNFNSRWRNTIIFSSRNHFHWSSVGDPHGRLVGDSRILVGDPHISVSNENMGISNKNLGSPMKNWGASIQEYEGLQRDVCGGSPIELQWWWFLPRLLKRYTHEKRSRLKNNQCSLRTWNLAICSNLDAIGKALQFLYYFIHCKWSKGVIFVE